MGPRFTVSQRSSWPTLRCVLLFSPYYRQDDSRTAGAMDMFYRDALQAYADVPYKDLHAYLERRFHAWYTKFKPASSEVVGVEDAEVGDVVSVGGVDGEAPPLQKNQVQPDLWCRSGCAPACPGGGGGVNFRRQATRQLLGRGPERHLQT